MKDLLKALRIQAVDSIPKLGGEKAVHLLPDENVLPETTPFPCIGLKDGTIKNQYKVGATDAFLDVDIIGYVQVSRPEGVIIGDSQSMGILDLMDAAKSAFKEFDPEGYQWIAPAGEIIEPGSQMMNAGPDRLIQKKKITMRWFKRQI